MKETLHQMLMPIILVAVGMLLMVAIVWIRNRRRRAKGIPDSMGDNAITQENLPTSASQYSEGRQPHIDRLPRHPPSIGKTVLWIMGVILALGLGAAVVVYGTMRFQKTDKTVAVETPKADPCAKCKPDELVVRRMDANDNYLWFGTCTGGVECALCAVVDCNAIDDVAAAKACRCRK